MSQQHTMHDETASLEPAPAWRDLHVALATPLRRPDDRLTSALEESYATELTDITAEIGLDVDVPLEPPAVADRDLTSDYAAIFEAAETPYAPPAESPYKPWYGDRGGGLMGGPSATNMERRYETIDATVPDAYPADHVALLLEYASVLLEADEHDQYRSFVATHLDWLPAFRRLTEEAAADAPLQRWAVGLTDAVLAEVRERLGIAHPAADEIERMAGRIGTD